MTRGRIITAGSASILDKLGLVVSLDRSLNLPVSVATGALIVIGVASTIPVTVVPG